MSFLLQCRTLTLDSLIRDASESNRVRQDARETSSLSRGTRESSRDWPVGLNIRVLYFRHPHRHTLCWSKWVNLGYKSTCAWVA